MPSTRSKLILDEESFQGLLAAAFTIQQYNAREGGIDAALSAELNETLGTSRGSANDGADVVETEDRENDDDGGATTSVELCQQCGAALPAAGVPCRACDAEVFRPGERLQRTWATMWSMSQEQQSQLPGRISLPKPIGPELVPDLVSELRPEHVPDLATGKDKGKEKENYPADDLIFRAHDGTAAAELGDTFANPATDASIVASETPAPRLKLRFKRADLYLGLAIFVAFVAVFWPAASARRSELRPWERMLIAMGIADPPTQAAEVHYSGDPNIKVWVDTEAALYYCPGDDLYGKSRGGYYSTQHEAQLDRFEPALRRACVQ
jgi:ribosomal protein L40E